MLFTSAYTGIASEHPSVFTQARILQNTGIQGPYEESFKRGSNLPTLEWWVLLAHIGMMGLHYPLPWVNHE